MKRLRTLWVCAAMLLPCSAALAQQSIPSPSQVAPPDALEFFTLDAVKFHR